LGDFCTKYPVPEARPDQIRFFIDKLWEKRQTPLQQKQPAHTVFLYFEMQRKSKIPVGEFKTDKTTSVIPEPRQIQDRSSSWPQVHYTKDNLICYVTPASTLASFF
jgi:hypothetical protein